MAGGREAGVSASVVIATDSGADLPRTIGLLDATAIVVGTVIGSAIFLVPNSIAAALPSAPSILLVWIVSGVLSFFGALAFAELGAMMPDTGGQYVYLREAYGPLVGFVSGWALFLVIQTGSLATLAAGFSIYLGYFVPLSVTGERIASVALIAVLSAVNYRGVLLGVGVQRVFTFLKLAGLTIIVAAAFLTPHRAAATAAVAAPINWSQFGVAMIACLWAYEGWSSVSFVAGEVRRPSRNLPLALALGTALLVVIYLTANLAYMRVLTIPEIAAASRVAARVADISLGPSGATLVALTILISIVGSSNGTGTDAGTDLLRAGARRPLFFVARPRAPAVPDAACGDRGAGRVGIGARRERIVRTAVSYVIFTSWIFYSLAVLAVVVLRRRWPDREPAVPDVGISRHAIAVRGRRLLVRAEHDCHHAAARRSSAWRSSPPASPPTSSGERSNRVPRFRRPTPAATPTYLARGRISWPVAYCSIAWPIHPRSGRWRRARAGRPRAVEHARNRREPEIDVRLFA